VRAFVRPQCLIARGDPLCHRTENKLKQQVGVQLPTPAGNVTLLAFAVERLVVVCRAALAPHGRRYRSISPARRAHSSKPTARCFCGR